MLLHELPWQQLQHGGNWSYCFVTRTIIIWRFRYELEGEGYEIRDIAASGDGLWSNLTSIAAQAILYEITKKDAHS